MHQNESIFPKPLEFIPERWLDRAERIRLEKYLVPFSKGSRQCLGINLAKAEIYLGLAMVHRRFEMQLFETTREDVEVKRDLFLPLPKAGSKGVRVILV